MKALAAALLVAAARVAAWALHLPADEWADLSDE